MRTHHAYAENLPESNDNVIQTPPRSQSVGEGGYSQDFTIDPPGLRGLNLLAVRLNGLMKNGTISGWHLGHWRNRAQTLHSVLFSSALELNAAHARHRLSLRFTQHD